MTTAKDLERAIGKDVYDVEGHKVGTATNLYASDRSGEPEWVTVRTGLFGTKESFVPLAGARSDAKGLYVGARKDVIKDAPRIDEEEHLSETEAAELYRHYNLESAPSGRAGDQGMGQGSGMDQGKGNAKGDNAKGQAYSEGMTQPGTPGPDGQHARGTAGHESMVRSEEQLRAGTETVETGRVRLRKHIVTEEQQVTVPVSHEEVHVTREPISAEGARTGRAAELSDDEREVVLHEERPVVGTETVAVERVGMDTETVREEQQVSGTVRKEQIDVMNDSDGKRKRS